MKLKSFSKEIVNIMPVIHLYLIKHQPNMLTKGKMTFPQMVILDFLRTSGVSKMTDLSKVLGVTKSAVTGLIDRMIKMDLIKRTRSKEDRRVVRVTLTGRGITFANQLTNDKLKMISSLFSIISERERAQYLKILRKLHRAIRTRKARKA